MRKSILIAALAVASMTVVAGEETTAALERTKKNVSAWAAKGKRLGLKKGRQVRDARQHKLDDRHAINEVRFEGGGFALTSANDGTDRVIAFSDTGSFTAATNSPLWALLSKDVARRDAAPTVRLPKLVYAPDNAVTEIDDLRVAPLLTTKWGQEYVYGEAGDEMVDDSGRAIDENDERIPGFNYYTPYNVYVGCVATAMSQIMRLHEWPKTAIEGFSATCDFEYYTYDWLEGDYVLADGGKTNLVVQPHTYDWSKMPNAINRNTSEAERRELSQLSFDCGVSVDMSYSNYGSGAWTPAVAEALTSKFDYANAKYMMFMPDDTDKNFAEYFMKGGVLDSIRERTICSNLDAGYPVQLGIGYDHYKDIEVTRVPYMNDYGHSVVADGYGYSGGTLFTHLNMGWYGQCDIWYALPVIDATYNDPTSGNYFNAIYSIVYNIFPEGTGEIVSGRVFGTDGNAAPNVTIKAYQGETEKGSTTANDKGIYALKLTAGDYRLEATVDGSAFTTNLTVVASQLPSENQTDQGRRTFGVCGNVWGADLHLAAVEPEPTTVPDYVVIAPSAYVDLWKWYVGERANLPGGKKPDGTPYVFGVKDAAEIYAAYQPNPEATDGSPRNHAESIHKWIGEQAAKGTKYFVLGGVWFDVQQPNSQKSLASGEKIDLTTAIPGIVTYPVVGHDAPTAVMSSYPSDLYYACHSSASTYAWDKDGDQEYLSLGETVTIADLTPSCVVSRMDFIPGAYTGKDGSLLNYASLVTNYVAKLSRGESADFEGHDRYISYINYCLKFDEDTGAPDVYGVMNERLNSVSSFRTPQELYLAAYNEKGCDWEGMTARAMNENWEISMPFGHGIPDLCAFIDEAYYKTATGVTKFFMGNIPCYTGTVSTRDDKNRRVASIAQSSLGNPKGGSLVSVNNTCTGQLTYPAITQRYVGMSDELFDYTLDFYLAGKTAGQAWQGAISKFSTIMFSDLEAEFERRECVVDEDYPYFISIIVEQMLFGDPLVKIDYSAEPDPEPPVTTVVATVFDGSETTEFTSFAAAMAAATNTEAVARLTIKGNLTLDFAVAFPSTVTLQIDAGASLSAPQITINGALRGPGVLGGTIIFGENATLDARTSAVALASGSTLTFAESLQMAMFYAYAEPGAPLFSGAANSAMLTNRPTVYRADDEQYVPYIMGTTGSTGGLSLVTSPVTIGDAFVFYSIADAIDFVSGVGQDWDLALSDIVITDESVDVPNGYVLKSTGEGSWGVYKNGKVPKILFR